MWLLVVYVGLGAVGCNKLKPVKSSSEAVEFEREIDSAQPMSDSQEHNGLVGSDACLECHTDIYRSYKKHPMWASTIEVGDDDDRPWKKGNLHFVPGKSRVLASKKDSQGNVVHSEIIFDELGKPIYEQSHKMDYVIGSGQMDNAIDEWEKAVEIDPGFVPLRELLAEAYSKQG